MKPSRLQEKRALFFDAIAHRRRQMIVSILIAQGKKGLSFAQLGRQANLPAATLSFHLRQMDKGCILHQRIRGAQTWISIDLGFLRLMTADFLTDCTVQPLYQAA